MFFVCLGGVGAFLAVLGLTIVAVLAVFALMALALCMRCLPTAVASSQSRPSALARSVGLSQRAPTLGLLRRWLLCGHVCSYLLD